MKNRKTFYVNIRDWPTIIAVTLILGAILTLVISSYLTGSYREYALRIFLLSGAEFLTVLIVLLQGRELFYRTAVPVAIAFLLEILLVSPYLTKSQDLILIVLYACIAVVYTLMVAGKLRKKIWLPFLTVSALLIVYIEGLPTQLQALPSLLALSGYLVLCLSMKEHDDDCHHRCWGDRSDGRLVRTLSPITDVGIYIMPKRNGAHTMFADTLDVTELDRYIHVKRREDIPHLSMVQIFLAAYCRTVAEYPALNRFISGQKIYSRDEDIVFSMIVKKKMTIEGEETAIKVHLTPEETLYTVSEKLEKTIQEGRLEEDSDFDKTAAVIRAIPGLIKKLFVWLLNLLDYFGLLPAFLLEVSPFHGSIFFTSMASLGIPPVYHHLYDFGNLPVFLCLGEKYKENVLQDDGSVISRKFMKYTVVSDERICDGFYYSRGLRAFKRYIQHPELLESPPETVNHDIP